MDTKTALNHLLAAPEFREFERSLVQTNLLRLLGVETRELSHTRLLSWLLDPSAPHGLGGEPVTTFLHLCWNSARDGQDCWLLPPATLDSIDLDRLVVTAEFDTRTNGRLDVFGFFESNDVENDAESKLVPLFLIEYKVGASEGDGQTKKYREWIDRVQAADCVPPGLESSVRPSLIYLTPSGEKPEDDAFASLSYSEYLGWLAGLDTGPNLTDIGRTAVDQLRNCIAGSIGSISAEQSCLEDKQKDALAVLRSYSNSEDVVAARSRHRDAFDALRIKPQGRRSYGESPFVEAVCDLLDADQTIQREWASTRGRGSLSYWAKRVTVASRTHYPNQPSAIWGYLWMQRPANGSTRLDFGFGTSQSSMKGKPAELAAKLRKRIKEQDHKPESVDIGKDRTAVVARLQMNLDTGPDGAPETAESAQKALERYQDQIVEFTGLITDLLQVPQLDQWVKELLPPESNSTPS
ncbi:MAG: PD-(D/E)XK nuclease family protein [Planctomycetes bacterium]|nr:PD-(D/E)XK nuclease family protein [Planctomycetota bacterium]